MKNLISVPLILLICLLSGPLVAGKPVDTYGRFTATASGAVNGAWTSKEYKLTNKTTGINFNASGGTHYLYFSEAFISAFGAAGIECFGDENGNPADLGGTAQIRKEGSRKDPDHIMTLWIHAPNSNPNDEEIIFYALDLFTADLTPSWEGPFPPYAGDPDGSFNVAVRWVMRTAGKGYLNYEPCLGSGYFFEDEVVTINIKRLY